MKLLVLGDTHADTVFTRSAVEMAAQLGCSRIVQVGDFGFWPSFSGGQEFLSRIRKGLHKHQIELSFVRGNHEDHEALDHLDQCHGPDSLLTPEGFVVVRKPKHGAIYSMPRAGNWEWDGVRFGCLGGAYSIDQRYRTKFVDWFPQEMPTMDDVERLSPCDVLFTHDAPQLLLPPLGDHRDDEGAPSGAAVRAAVARCRPTLLVHGHWHVNTVYTFEGTVCVGLGCNLDGLNAAAIVLDTERRVWFNLNEALYGGEGTPWGV